MLPSPTSSMSQRLADVTVSHTLLVRPFTAEQMLVSELIVRIVAPFHQPRPAGTAPVQDYGG